MYRSPISVLSRMDFNGKPPEDRLFSRRFHQLMAEHGYVFVYNVPGTFDHVRFCRGLGEFLPTYTGAVIGDVRPEPDMDDVSHSGNTGSLTPHTQGYDFQVLPPRYLALWCVHPADGRGGETTIADTTPWVNMLTDDQRTALTNTEHEWTTTEGVNRLGLNLHAKHPILEDHPDGLSSDSRVRTCCALTEMLPLNSNAFGTVSSTKSTSQSTISETTCLCGTTGSYCTAGTRSAIGTDTSGESRSRRRMTDVRVNGRCRTRSSRLLEDT
ncbi:TauD/TfdA family dioxygenase [Kibdelosporangium aridum]|uniref:TauD/TfdA family dioxygenase n=1 Tax=Kibdelosporangium aridum TaxID=2030 RepID=UPI000526E323